MQVDDEFLKTIEKLESAFAARKTATLPRKKRTLVDLSGEIQFEGTQDIETAELRRRFETVSVFGAKASAVEYERILGNNDLVDEFFLQRALAAATPICRILYNGNAHGTGFLIAPSILMTNNHVLRSKTDAMKASAEFNYKLDIAGNDQESFKFELLPNAFFETSPDFDYTLVAVAEKSEDGKEELKQFGYHKLIDFNLEIKDDEFVTIIQHPGGKYRQFALRENKVVSVTTKTLWYMSDTSQGSSGAPAFNDSFQLIALHHSGVPRKNEQGKILLKDGRTVDSLKGEDESNVDWQCNEGIRIRAICDDIRKKVDFSSPDAFVAQLFDALDPSNEKDVMSRCVRSATNGPSPKPGGKQAGTNGKIIVPAALPTESGLRNDFEMNHRSLYIQNNHGSIYIQSPPGSNGSGPKSVTVKESSDEAQFERMREPSHDENYSKRTGYADDFLGSSVPLPKVKNKSVIAETEDGEQELKYQHFSVVMHKTRRLAIFTAANVAGSSEQRNPGGIAPTRRQLTNLDKSDQEKWFLDPRLSEEYQLTDVFYTKDGGAFDKGHIVRREDVCWGKNLKEIARANGDTFHITNCSPQVANFNRSNKGGIWGKLENYVLGAAKSDSDKYCIFSGPVLSDDDRKFTGRAQTGYTEVQIPKAFWKVLVCKSGKKLQSFGFMLEQSLAEVETFEFAVAEEWLPYFMPIAEIEAEIGLIRFPKIVHDADQYSDEFKESLEKVVKSPKPSRSRYRLQV